MWEWLVIYVLYKYTPNEGTGVRTILLEITSLQGSTWIGLAGEVDDATTAVGSLDACAQEDSLIIIFLIESTPSPPFLSTKHLLTLHKK
jgi:hypothetical protein